MSKHVFMICDRIHIRLLEYTEEENEAGPPLGFGPSHYHLASHFCICDILWKTSETVLSISMLDFLVVAK